MNLAIEPTRLEAERDKWLTVDEVAFVLRTTPATIQRAINDGHLPLFAPGKVWRIHVDSLPKCQKIISDWTRA